MLLSSMVKVRILHQTATKPTHEGSIVDHLQAVGCPIEPPAIRRLLLRMNRAGLIASKMSATSGGAASRKYSVTPKGREALKVARDGLRQFAPVWKA